MSEKMNDDKLYALKSLALPAPSEEARRRAVNAALLAFDAEQEKTAAAPQGSAAEGRLRSIVAKLGRTLAMDTRLTFGLTTAAAALLLLPLGYQLYTSTAISPLPPPVPEARQEQDEAPQPLQQPQVTAADGEAEAARPGDAVVPAPQPTTPAAGEAPVLQKVAPDAAGRAAVPMPTAESAPPFDAAIGAAAPEAMFAPTEPSGDEFTGFAESPVKVVAEEPVSTFSVDVDTAAYAYVRRLLNDGLLPQPDAVRIEELINYFDYGYEPALSASEPFRPTLQVFPTPWNEFTRLLQIGIKGYVPPAGEDRASNLTFLIDTSGSMDEPDKLPLLKRAFGLLVEQLSGNDTVSIVAYAGSAGVVLEPTPASDKAKILAALETLGAGGSTAGAAGIELAYRLAAQTRSEGSINRVILATDGDFNVGIDDPEDLTDFIKARREDGVFLSVLGFGQGNLGDDTMQALAQNGNGVAAYIDSYREAQKVLVEQVGGTLETIAKDVKVQVEFNPAMVAEYRLVGYETRALAREDFNNDRVDAGDVGAGHTVTALYEITPVGAGASMVDPLRYGEREAAPAATGAASSGTEYGFLKMRFKLPDQDASQLIEAPITTGLAVDGLASASEDARWAAAVAAFGQKLKGSVYGEMDWSEIRSLAQGARGSDENGYRAEFMQLINLAAGLLPDN